MKRSKLKLLRPKVALPPESPKESIPTPPLFTDISFVSDLSLANNNNNNNNDVIKNHEQQDYVIDPDRLVRGNLIGKGEFASVFAGS